ncbi:MAG: FtsX-like permease family protein, partial [Thermoanaerobaculia bacterium]
QKTAHTVVGVVRRVKVDGVQEDLGRVQGYFSYQQRTWNSMEMVLRTRVEPQSLTEAARDQIQSIDPDEPIFAIRTGDGLWDEAVAPQRMNLLLLGIFAAIALLLAAVGIYGVMAYSVSQRTHEIGIRMALGASSGRVTGLIVKNGMTLAVLGLGIGFGGALVLTRFMSALLFNVKATDTLTFMSIPLVLGVVAFVANFVPAIRAARMDPMRALHYE